MVKHLKNRLVKICLVVFLSLASLAIAQTYYKIGDELPAGDHKVKIIDISIQDVLVDVDGKRGDVTLNDTELVNGVNITVRDIFYHIDRTGRLAWIELVNVYSLKDQCTNNSQCDDGNPCTLDKCAGSPRRCDYDDSHFVINYCLNGDGCCNPDYCGWREDTDCPFVPKFGCKKDSDCKDEGLKWTRAVCGSDGFCNHVNITECLTGDGYCPDGCYSSITNDKDCNKANKCVWNADCDDANPCTIDLGCVEDEQGIKECRRQPVLACLSGDRCCPAGCSYPDDLECDSSGSINLQEGGTPSYSCINDEDCGGAARCIDNRCTVVYDREEGISIFAKLINFIKRLFLPSR